MAYTPGRGFGSYGSMSRSGSQGAGKGGGFWLGRPEFTGGASNYDRWTIRPLTVARGDPKADVRMGIALARGGKEFYNYKKRGGAEGVQQRMEEGGEYLARGWDIQEAHDQKMWDLAQRGRNKPPGGGDDAGDTSWKPPFPAPSGRPADTDAPYGRDAFGEPYSPPRTYEEGIKPSTPTPTVDPFGDTYNTPRSRREGRKSAESHTPPITMEWTPGPDSPYTIVGHSPNVKINEPPL